MLTKNLQLLTALLALLSLLWTAASKWQSLTDRVTTLEQRDLYEHGTYQLPSK